MYQHFKIEKTNFIAEGLQFPAVQIAYNLLLYQPIGFKVISAGAQMLQILESGQTWKRSTFCGRKTKWIKFNM